jgi:general secretion pathway protein I
MTSRKHQGGFTLIEVLLALSILAIALTALLKATASTVNGTRRIKEKNISHLVAMQGISMLQMGIVKAHTGQNITKEMTLFGQTWHWNADISQTPIPGVEKIIIRTSASAGGPFRDPLIAYRGPIKDE